MENFNEGGNDGAEENINSCSRELQIRVQNTLLGGTVSKLMTKRSYSSLDLVDAYGDVVIGAIMTGKLHALDLLKKEGDNKDES